MQRVQQPRSSFDRVFARASPDANAPSESQNGDGLPSVHELFSMLMRDEISLRDFAQGLRSLHGIQLTDAAIRLLTSVDANSGRLSFAQFQRSLQEDGAPQGGAGLPMIISDQAAAIISDNCGAPVAAAAPSQACTRRPATDINADPFIKAQHRVERNTNRGQMSNPVLQTNNVSPGNPLAGAACTRSEAGSEDPYSEREMAYSATRMYVAGELSQGDYEKFLLKFGVHLESESELARLIRTHGKVGDGNFVQMSRALKRELVALDGAAAPAQEAVAPMKAAGVVGYQR